MTGQPTHWMSCGHPFTESTLWNPKFCIVTDCQLLLLNKEKAPPFLLQDPRTGTSRTRLLRRTISVPAESHLPDYQEDLSPGSVFVRGGDDLVCFLRVGCLGLHLADAALSFPQMSNLRFEQRPTKEKGHCVFKSRQLWPPEKGLRVALASRPAGAPARCSAVGRIQAVRPRQSSRQMPCSSKSPGSPAVEKVKSNPLAPSPAPALLPLPGTCLN
ncbi:hypothetical protein Z043_106818 [Scleropages formosus]|uniref:Uncharacterized protein n=1 Tax=Scleropages formosus TaxID=113540 RepID=A0A0P7UIF6_SCLFO|nr:hypothetical protein Z043_106818 [Scleropages formosus]